MEENIYLPSSSERKRAIVAYLLVGLFFFSGKEELTVFEYYHYKQAIGWYCVLMFSLLLWLIVFWIPVIRWIPFLLVLANLVVAVIFVMIAWKWDYSANVLEKQKWKMIYADIGGWLLGLFEIKKRVYWDIASDTWISLDNFQEITNNEPENTNNAPESTPNMPENTPDLPESLG